MICGLGMARRGWIMLALSGKQRRRGHAPEHIVCTSYVDIGFGALETGGAGLILGMRFAGCRGFAA